MGLNPPLQRKPVATPGVLARLRTFFRPARVLTRLSEAAEEHESSPIAKHEPKTAPPRKEVEVSLLGEEKRMTEEFTIR